MGEALNFAALGVTSIRRGDPCAPAQASVVVVSPGGTTSRDVLAEFAENEVANIARSCVQCAVWNDTSGYGSSSTPSRAWT